MSANVDNKICSIDFLRTLVKLTLKRLLAVTSHVARTCRGGMKTLERGPTATVTHATHRGMVQLDAV